ncbi:MAG: hypothetical protein OEW77_12045, partial [Gemmatimonadota bacterium]|nr:hypothetical protein [Gemmatimonadota bacterium]
MKPSAATTIAAPENRRPARMLCRAIATVRWPIRTASSTRVTSSTSSTIPAASAEMPPPCAERDADGRGRERRRIVGAVAHHEHAAALAFERLHRLHLLLWKQVAVRLADAEGARDGDHVLLVVAGEEHGAAEPERAQPLDELGEPGTHAVGERDDAGRPPVHGDVGAQAGAR